MQCHLRRLGLAPRSFCKRFLQKYKKINRYLLKLTCFVRRIGPMHLIYLRNIQKWYLSNSQQSDSYKM
jgi:hypothetical protein